MAKSPGTANLPAVIDGQGRSLTVVPNQIVQLEAAKAKPSDTPEPEHAEGFDREPPIEVIIDADQLKERIIEYLGAVLARCWTDHTLLSQSAANPHVALRHLGILLPGEIDIKVERPNQSRPRLVIYEWNRERSFRRRICYLQLIMMAGQ